MKLKIDTVIRTVLLALALINQALSIFGKSPIPVTDEQATLLISTVFTIVMAVWSWWKNNSLTSAAQKADTVMYAIKRGEISLEEADNAVETILNKRGQ